MTPRQRALKVAEGFGATVEVDSSALTFTITADAPEGKVWIEGGGLHRLVATQAVGFDTSSCWCDLHERMMLGIEPCPDRPDCDLCD